MTATVPTAAEYDALASVVTDAVAKIADLEARVDALESVPPVDPPVDPPPVTPAYRTVNVARGKIGYTPAAGETLSYVHFVGAGDDVYDGSSIGVKITKDGVTLDHVICSGFGDSGVRMDACKNVTLLDVEVDDCAYAGIIGTGVTNVTIKRPIIRRIGTHGKHPQSNAYGIVPTMWGGGARSTDWLVEDAYIEDIPSWHGFDTHGGQRITFRRPTTKRVARPVFITDNLVGENPSDVTVEAGNYTASKSTYPGDPNAQDGRSAITVNKATKVILTNNAIGTSYPTPVNNLGGTSQVAETGTTRIPG